MAKVWTCACGAMNEGTRTCDACNQPRRRGDDPKPDASSWQPHCQWTTEGTRCRLRPTMQENYRRQFCQWHYCVGQDPRLGHDLEAFTRFCEDIGARKYCSIYAHYPVAYLWACVRGQEPAHLEPFPCQQEGCALRPDWVPPGFSPKVAAEQVQRDLTLAAHRELTAEDDW